MWEFPPAGYSIFLLSELHTKNILKTYSGGTTEMFQRVKYMHMWRLAGKPQNDTEGAFKIEICALLSLLCRHRRPSDSGRCFSADRSMLIKIGCDSDCGLMEAKREKERGNFRDDDWKNEKWLLFPGVMESYCMRARKANTSTSSSPFSNWRCGMRLHLIGLSENKIPTIKSATLQQNHLSDSMRPNVYCKTALCAPWFLTVHWGFGILLVDVDMLLEKMTSILSHRNVEIIESQAGELSKGYRASEPARNSTRYSKRNRIDKMPSLPNSLFTLYLL